MRTRGSFGLQCAWNGCSAGQRALRPRYAEPSNTALVAQLRATPWVVSAKRPFGGPAQVLQSLGRYTHRIAISNARLVRLTDGVVQFRWTDYADRGHAKIMALDVDEFLRRFLLHVLPRGFVRIRHVGLLANRQRRTAILRARHLLAAPTPDATADRAPAADLDPTLCALSTRPLAGGGDRPPHRSGAHAGRT